MLNDVQNAYPVTAYVDKSTLEKIEKLRGDVARSKFLGKIIKKSIDQ